MEWAFLILVLLIAFNVRGHVRANVIRVEGPGGANCRCDCDGYRPDTLGNCLGSTDNRRFANSAARSCDEINN